MRGVWSDMTCVVLSFLSAVTGARGAEQRFLCYPPNDHEISPEGQVLFLLFFGQENVQE